MAAAINAGNGSGVKNNDLFGGRNDSVFKLSQICFPAHAVPATLGHRRQSGRGIALITHEFCTKRLGLP